MLHRWSKSVRSGLRGGVWMREKQAYKILLKRLLLSEKAKAEKRRECIVSNWTRVCCSYADNTCVFLNYCSRESCELCLNTQEDVKLWTHRVNIVTGKKLWNFSNGSTGFVSRRCTCAHSTIPFCRSPKTQWSLWKRYCLPNWAIKADSRIHSLILAHIFLKSGNFPKKTFIVRIRQALFITLSVKKKYFCYILLSNPKHY